MKIAIVHYQPLELYPPVMNMISFLATKKNVIVNVTTTRCDKKASFAERNTDILRFGSSSDSKISLYLTYFAFNCIGFLSLLWQRPNRILCYETVSVFSVYWYKKLFPATKIYIHYHEYYPKKAVANASKYMQYLAYLEQKLYLKANWVSQTNEDRLARFAAENNALLATTLQIMPNIHQRSGMSGRY